MVDSLKLSMLSKKGSPPPGTLLGWVFYVVTTYDQPSPTGLEQPNG